MIRFPSLDVIEERSNKLRIPLPVVVRDIARLVEIPNLKEKGFFDARSVLAGGMAMRTYGSQRLTIYDADLATRTVTMPSQTTKLLSYASTEIELTPAPLVPTSDQGSVWKSDPVEFEPLWLTVALTEEDRRFKVDLAGYGVFEDGEERPLTDPYELGLWDDADAPSVIVMRLEEIAAEKTLGWCAYGQYKHLADLAFIGDRLADRVDPRLLRNLTADKLKNMSKLQPDNYERFSCLEDLIRDLENPGPIPSQAVNRVAFLQNPYTPAEVVSIVRRRYVPLLKGIASS